MIRFGIQHTPGGIDDLRCRVVDGYSRVVLKHRSARSGTCWRRRRPYLQGGSFRATRRSLPDKPDVLSPEVVRVSVVCIVASFRGWGVPSLHGTAPCSLPLLLATVRFHPTLI
jgi:hypothetical protein